jgi:hypothetical protein
LDGGSWSLGARFPAAKNMPLLKNISVEIRVVEEEK